MRDVRAMGGTGGSEIHVQLEARVAQESVRPPESNDGILISDVVERRLASPYASVELVNSESCVVEVSGISTNASACAAKLISDKPIRIIPGQTRSVPFLLTCLNLDIAAVEVIVEHKGRAPEKAPTGGACTTAGRVVFSEKLRHVSRYEAHKLTHLHPGGVVSYAILRPPSERALQDISQNESLPLLLNLHGAGVEADSDLVRHSLDEVPDLKAWTLFPTGVTPWSGDDWHTWGFADVEAAIAALPCWIGEVGWTSAGVDVGRWTVVGHSNGGGRCPVVHWSVRAAKQMKGRECGTL